MGQILEGRKEKMVDQVYVSDTHNSMGVTQIQNETVTREPEFLATSEAVINVKYSALNSSSGPVFLP